MTDFTAGLACAPADRRLLTPPSFLSRSAAAYPDRMARIRGAPVAGAALNAIDMRRDAAHLYAADRLEALARVRENLKMGIALSEPGGAEACAAAAALLASRGVAPEDVHADAFFTEAEKAAAGAP